MARAVNFNILMIGNSYTSGRSTEPLGGTDEDLQGIFDADPMHSATVVTRAESSWTLRDHDQSLDTTNLITSGSVIWDVIVLQEQSTLPAQAMNTGTGSNTLRRGGPELIDLVKAQSHLQSASVVLFNTWARELGNSVLDDYNDDPKEMLAFTNQGYDYIRQNSPSWDHSDITTIARVGDAWDTWYDTHGYGVSGARLHDNDGSHQSGLGSYLAASVIYETITGDSTIGNSFTGTYQNGVSGSIGGDSKLFLLQQQASATTGVANTADFDRDGDVDGSDFLILQRGFGPKSGSTLTAGDGNLDGDVDGVDLGIWQQQYGSTQVSALLATVPEPASLGLGLICLVMLSGKHIHPLQACSRPGMLRIQFECPLKE